MNALSTFVLAVVLTFISAVFLLTLVSALWAAYERLDTYLRENRNERA